MESSFIKVHLSLVGVYQRTRVLDKKVGPSRAHRHPNQGSGKRNTHPIADVHAAVALLILLPIRRRKHQHTITSAA